jgi:RHS repeat-associated protein
MTDDTGDIAQTYVYDAFGRIVQKTGSIKNPYTYTGREWDEEAGLYYYRARYYDANTGRFIQEDPISFAGGDMNLYVYVGNNPVNFSDHFGLMSTQDFTGSSLKKLAFTILGGINQKAKEITYLSRQGKPIIIYDSVRFQKVAKVFRVVAWLDRVIGANLSIQKYICTSQRFIAGKADAGELWHDWGMMGLKTLSVVIPDPGFSHLSWIADATDWVTSERIRP